MSERSRYDPPPRFVLGAEQRARLRKDIDLALLERLLAKLTDTDRARVLRTLDAEAFSPEPSADGFRTLEVPLLPSDELRRELEAVLAPARARLRAENADEGQALPASALTPFLLALLGPEQAGSERRAFIVRRSPAHGGDIVAVRDGEDAGTALETAVARLIVLRTAAESPPQITRIDVEAPNEGAVLSPRVKRALAICLQGAREGAIESVPEVGAARTIEVWLPGSRH